MLSCASLQGTSQQDVTVDDVYYTPSEEEVNEPETVVQNPEPYVNQSNKVERAYTKTDTYGDDRLNDVYNENQDFDDTIEGYASEGFSYEQHFNRLNGDDYYDFGYEDGYYDGLDDNRFTRRNWRSRSNRGYDPYWYDWDYYNNFYSVGYGWNPCRFNRWNRPNVYIGYSSWGGWYGGVDYGWNRWNRWNNWGSGWNSWNGGWTCYPTYNYGWYNWG